MKYALIYSYEHHNYELVENNRATGKSSIEKLYEFTQHELSTAKKILSNLSQAQAA
ncbi:MAG: hypothetical protein R8G66_18205 [Cytophagales bacterium]|nr:hypothetical protein [Cytophagales bacterium]